MSDLMFHCSDNLFLDINHADDFGELDKEILTGALLDSVPVSDFDYEDGDLFKSSIDDGIPYGNDRAPWNGDTPKQSLAISVETDMVATQKMRRLSLGSLEKPTSFLQFPQAKSESESSPLMGYPSSNSITNAFIPVNYSTSMVSPTAQLASLASQTISLANGSTQVTICAAKELVREEKNNVSTQYSSASATSSAIDLSSFVSKADATGDSLSPLPTYVQRTAMMQRSFSSHSLGQLRAVPRVNEASFYPQISPIYSSVQELPSPNSKMQPQLSDLQGVNMRPTLKSMRRVYSTGDIQTINVPQMSHGSGSPLASEHSSIEEAGFKIGRYSAEERKQRIHRYRKKRNERNFNKKIKYACRKTLADSRPRVRGRFARNEDAGETPKKSNGGNLEEDEEEEVDAAQEEEEEFLIGNNPATVFGGMFGIIPVNAKNGYSLRY